MRIDQSPDLSGVEVVHDQTDALSPAAPIRSPVSSMVSGRAISDGPRTRLLRPVA